MKHTAYLVTVVEITPHLYKHYLIKVLIVTSLFDWSPEFNEFNPNLNNSKISRPILNVNLDLRCSPSRMPHGFNTLAGYYCSDLNNESNI